MSAPLFIGTRREDGSLADFYGVYDLASARAYAQERADSLPATQSAWLISGDPYNQFSSVLDTFPGTRV